MQRGDLGRFGVWLRPAQLGPDSAGEIESLGWTTLWLGGSPSGDLADVERVLAETSSLIVATGIVNIWSDDAETVARAYQRVEERFPGRFLLGVGAGHPEATAQYTKPYEALVHYLDVLDEFEVPSSRRILAALGPRVLQLAADRTAGAHPYLVPPEHSARAREVLGPDEILAPEHKVVLAEDAVEAREIARPPVANPYLGLRNYTSNLERLGYDRADIADGGSDRLIDDLVAWGSPDEIRRRLTAHLDAGADHVAVQVLPGPQGDVMPGLRTLADLLL